MPNVDTSPVGLTVKGMKATFFDRPILDRVEKGEQQALLEIGSLTRTIARRSIKKRKKPSAPGEAPKSHGGQLKDFLFFAFDAEAKSVVIGPAALKQNNAFDTRHDQAAGGLLEFGGEFQLAYHDWSPMGWAIEKQKAAKEGRAPLKLAPFFNPRLSMKSKLVGKTTWKPAAVAARPFMKPAYDEMRPQLVRFFKNIV
jgi:hypothetical protein